ncbi:hypothetical protein [Saccharibacillus kuerlensis]|uniref:Uncharacterized protein n=1 Tax=Saccharibacillus kuerlensis TaxID=459527 RepID=A0ABQ2KUV5_9BACL|nr:hypothetical protein [Saccharibacillus kuerlensis]GGN94054.1 hypothetical protein GCM10010969_08420 [Saccharibacillus kuerlensis]
MFPNHLNGADEEAAKQKERNIHNEVRTTSIKGAIITALIIAVVTFLIFYGIAYFRTN